MLKLKSIKRGIKFFLQRLFCGFDESDTWSLDITIAKFILPRLIIFRRLTITYPCEFKSIKEWHQILDKIITAFKIITERSFEDLTKEELILKEEGLDLFRKYYHSLWW